MAFLRVFFRTLGFLSAIAIFIIFINILFYVSADNDNNFHYLEGDRDSKNIIAVINLNGPSVTHNNLISGIMIILIQRRKK